MHETEADLQELQRQLDESYANAGEHLRSIVRPERRLSAPDLVDELRGVFVLQLATVTARGEELIVMAHGTAREVNADHPEHLPYERYCREVYGHAWEHWKSHYEKLGRPSGYTAFIEPRRLFAARLSA